MPTDSREALVQLVHELSSPLSLLWMKFGDSRTDPASTAAVERLRQLHGYGAASLLVAPLPLEAKPVAPLLQEATRLLTLSGALGGPQLGDIEDCGALLPADDRWAEALICGVLEAATYGAAGASLGVTLRQSGDKTWLTVTSASELSRDPRMLAERLAIIAAASLALLCGGRLMVTASRPRATVMLRAARSEVEA
jgi:hypothetical protein